LHQKHLPDPLQEKQFPSPLQELHSSSRTLPVPPHFLHLPTPLHQLQLPVERHHLHLPVPSQVVQFGSPPPSLFGSDGVETAGSSLGDGIAAEVGCVGELLTSIPALPELFAELGVISTSLGCGLELGVLFITFTLGVIFDSISSTGLDSYPLGNLVNDRFL
jgi:hypothetical protein